MKQRDVTVVLSSEEQTAIQQWALHQHSNELVRGIAAKVTLASGKRRGRPRKKSALNPRDVAMIGGDPSL